MTKDEYFKGVAPAAPLFNQLEKIVNVVTSLMLVSLTILVSLEVLLRSAFGYSLGFVEEVSGYLVAGICLLGAAMAVRSNSLFQVEVISNKLSSSWRRYIDIIFAIVSIFICIVLAWKTFDLVSSSFNRGKISPTVLRTPLWIPQIMLPIGFLVIGTFITERLLILLFKPDLDNKGGNE